MLGRFLLEQVKLWVLVNFQSKETPYTGHTGPGRLLWMVIMFPCRTEKISQGWDPSLFGVLLGNFLFHFCFFLTRLSTVHTFCLPCVSIHFFFFSKHWVPRMYQALYHPLWSEDEWSVHSSLDPHSSAERTASRPGIKWCTGDTGEGLTLNAAGKKEQWAMDVINWEFIGKNL